MESLHKLKVDIFINIWLSLVKHVHFCIPNEEAEMTSEIH